MKSRKYISLNVKNDNDSCCGCNPFKIWSKPKPKLNHSASYWYKPSVQNQLEKQRLRKDGQTTYQISDETKVSLGNPRR